MFVLVCLLENSLLDYKLKLRCVQETTSIHEHFKMLTDQSSSPKKTSRAQSLTLISLLSEAIIYEHGPHRCY